MKEFAKRLEKLLRRLVPRSVRMAAKGQRNELGALHGHAHDSFLLDSHNFEPELRRDGGS